MVQPPVTTMASKNLCDSLHILQMHGSSFFCFCTGFAMSSLLEFHQNTWCTKEFPRWFRVSPDTTSSIQLRKNKKRFKMFSTRKHVQRGSKSMYSNYIAIAFSNIFQFLIQREPDWKGSYLICILFSSVQFSICIFFKDNKPPASPLAFMLLLQTTHESPGAQIQKSDITNIALHITLFLSIIL